MVYEDQIDMFQLAKDYVLASVEPDIRGERLDYVVDLMKKLHKQGFSSSELSILAGGRWSPSTIRGYCRGLGR